MALTMLKHVNPQSPFVCGALCIELATSQDITQHIAPLRFTARLQRTIQILNPLHGFNRAGCGGRRYR